MAAAGGCLLAVGLQFWTRSLQALPALLIPAVLLGLLLGAAAAALLYLCALGPCRRREVRGAGGRRAGSRRAGSRPCVLLSAAEKLGSVSGEEFAGVRTGLRGAAAPVGPGRAASPALLAARVSQGLPTLGRGPGRAAQGGAVLCCGGSGLGVSLVLGGQLRNP